MCIVGKKDLIGKRCSMERLKSTVGWGLFATMLAMPVIPDFFNISLWLALVPGMGVGLLRFRQPTFLLPVRLTSWVTDTMLYWALILGFMGLLVDFLENPRGITFTSIFAAATSMAGFVALFTCMHRKRCVDAWNLRNETLQI